MKRKQFLSGLFAMVGVIAGLSSTGFESAFAQSAVRSNRTPSPVSSTTLDATEIAGLQYMREEEKLAHDVYAALYAQWGTPVFNNIASSEAAHTDAVLTLLNAYGIADPAASNPPGTFSDLTLQALYNQLISQGHLSELEGLKVGALIEETDIRDIVDRQALTDESKITAVYENLLCGSRNHLRAFDRQLKIRGVSYVPVVITQEQWDAIANSARERCV